MNKPRASTAASRIKNRINSFIDYRMNQTRTLSNQRSLRDKNSGLQVRNVGGQSGVFATFGSTGGNRVGP